MDEDRRISANPFVFNNGYGYSHDSGAAEPPLNGVVACATLWPKGP
jgi:hypothetical protein